MLQVHLCVYDCVCVHVHGLEVSVFSYTLFNKGKLCWYSKPYNVWDACSHNEIKLI